MLRFQSHHIRYKLCSVEIMGLNTKQDIYMTDAEEIWIEKDRHLTLTQQINVKHKRVNKK